MISRIYLIVLKLLVLFLSNKVLKFIKYKSKVLHRVAAIQQEKGKQQLISGIENFDPAKLKHAETLEKNPLPTKEGSYTLLILDSFSNPSEIDAESVEFI